MNLSTLWLKGLSQQGKIYLATGSVALGAGITGTLAVDETRQAIWAQASHVGSFISSFLGKAFETSGAPPASSESSDSTVNEIFSSAWGGLTLVITRGATWSWKSITYAGKWVSEMKTTFNTAKEWGQTAWTNLKDHWYTFWIFLRSSVRSIDLMKIYELLANPSKRQIFTGSNGQQSQLKSVADKMKNIMSKSGSIGFDVGGPFRKLLKTFVEEQQNLSKVVQRLGFLETYVTGSQHSNKKDVVQALVDFFSEVEDKITKFDFKYEWGKSAK